MQMQSMQARAGAPTGLGLAPRSPLLAAPRTMLQRPVPAMQQAPRLPQQPSQQQFAGSTLELSKARGSMEHSIKCRAEAVAAQGQGGERNFREIILLTLLFGVWYGSNIMFNVYNKQLFAIFKYPLTTTCVQFLIGSVLSTIFWTFGLVKKPEMDATFFKGIYPLAVINVVGNVLTNVSLGLVAVSFTHTVKAAEPFFSVLFSYIFLGDLPPYQVLLTLLPIVGGVVIASASEASFNWGGFLSAIASNITFQSRNVLSKKFMNGLKGKPDSMMLFQVISILSFLTLLPVAILVEGTPALPASLAAKGLSEVAINKVYTYLLYAGLCFHGYQQLSYIVLSRLSPVSHSVGNSCKRVAVIVASLIWFRNPISTQNALGTSMALVGVFLYSQAKRLYGKKGSGGGGSD